MMCILNLRLGRLLTLHSPEDEVLAFLGGDGDTLHRRPSLLWLDGFGVFTMPQRTVACSISLCIYLDGEGRKEDAENAHDARGEKQGGEDEQQDDQEHRYDRGHAQEIDVVLTL